MAPLFLTHSVEGTPTIPPSYIQVRVVVWECGEWQSDTQTAMAITHFAQAMSQAKCNKYH